MLRLPVPAALSPNHLHRRSRPRLQRRVLPGPGQAAQRPPRTSWTRPSCVPSPRSASTPPSCKPRPYWLGWPGTTYDLDQHQKEYRARLAGSCQRLGIELHEEAKPVEDEAGVTAFLKAVRERKPDGLLVILQHMNCWGWADRLAKEAGVPLIVFSPIGTSFTGHVAGISRRRASIWSRPSNGPPSRTACA